MEKYRLHTIVENCDIRTETKIRMSSLENATFDSLNQALLNIFYTLGYRAYETKEGKEVSIFDPIGNYIAILRKFQIEEGK
jgi:hypothetical protein